MLELITIDVNESKEFNVKNQELPADFVVDAALAAAVEARAKEGKLACAQAFAIAEAAQVAPLVVGQTADALGVNLHRCQLGLYGYPGHTKGWAVSNIADHPVPEGLEAAIRAALDDEGWLSCARAWQVAAEFATPKMLVGYVADQMDIRIVNCQLGAF
ncbi:MAG: hypothetical protein ACP5J4_21155 [Anaerolineae bacterium]